MTDVGISDAKMKEMGAALPEGGSALFVLVRRVTGDKVLAQLDKYREKGRVLQTSLSDEQEAALRAALEKGAA